MSLSEPALSLTDLALGLVALWAWWAIRGRPGLSPHWARLFAWGAASALAGFVHHGWITYDESIAGPSWAVISGMVVVTVSYLLAATVDEVLGPGRWLAFWLLRSLSLVAYAIVALLGHAGVGAIMACESITMAAVLGLWVRGLRRGHPKARGVCVALLASMLAGAVRGMPTDLAELVGSDPETLYHIAQIPGLILLQRAAGPGSDGRAGDRVYTPDASS